MKKDVAVILMLLAFGTVLCHAQTIMVRVTNRAAFAREKETVSLLWSELNKKLPSLDRNSVIVVDKRRKDSLVVQTTERELLFQADFKAKETKSFTVTNGPSDRSQEPSLVDGRFVLPREDYAWENDRIAFRMYGPAMAKDVKNGIDVWTKRVRHLIVEKWYKESEGSPPGKDTYHMDRGEGADFFSVGKSLGAGSSAIWRHGRVFQPGVFSSYKTVAPGPLRVSFELSYDSLDVQGTVYKEVMRITLDAGQNLNRIEVTYVGPVKNEGMEFACGLVKRKNTSVFRNEQKCWTALWGPTTDDTATGSLGTALVLSPSAYKAMAEDDDQYLMVGKTRSGKTATYYAGAGWTRSGDFASAEDWNRYVERFAQRIRSPLAIRIAVKN